MTCGGQLPAWLDCSPPAQEARIKQLADLMAKAATGVSSVSDRGRSVSYRSPADMQMQIFRLRDEIAGCATGVWRGVRRLSYVDQVKGL
jgi:hypothetical protein